MANKEGLIYSPLDNTNEIDDSITNTAVLISRWIPVSERLPEKGNDYYLVTVGTVATVDTEELMTEVREDFFFELSQKWLYYDKDVIAWMPFPMPYSKESGE